MIGAGNETKVQPKSAVSKAVADGIFTAGFRPLLVVSMSVSDVWCDVAVGFNATAVMACMKEVT